jgi:hypothetical protein
VGERDWRIACETLRIALVNTFMPFQVSLEDVRAEVEQHHQEPPTVETLEWFLLRLAETGPHAGEYISRLESWWQDELDTVRKQSAGPKLEQILEELGKWYLRRPLKEECDAWADIVTSLRTAILRIYSRTDEATIEALIALEKELESLSAQPPTRDALQRLTQHIGEATPHGAEYMERVEYFRGRFVRLDQISDKEKAGKGVGGLL